MSGFSIMIQDDDPACRHRDTWDCRGQAGLGPVTARGNAGDRATWRQRGWSPRARRLQPAWGSYRVGRLFRFNNAKKVVG